MFNQKYLSANTSVNSVNLPAIYNKINWDRLIKKSIFKGKIRVLDYGCGKYTDHIKKFMRSKGIEWYGYDLNWNPDDTLLEKDYEIIVCSNVFNVIEEVDVILDIHNFIRNHCTYYYITIYEGDKSFVGRETKKGCWQRNEELWFYTYHADEVIKKKIITDEWGVEYIK